MWAKSPLSIITGGPGTGKTTTLRVILDIYKRVRPKGEILLAAPTGRASRRMVESTGHPAASTLHSALGLFADEEDRYLGGSQPLEADLVIVDEVSMIDMRLAAELFRRVEAGTQFLLVGDPDQLPSVGPGNVLRELLRCGLIPTVHLDIAYRQKNASRIALNAHTINEGDKDSLAYGEDFRFLPAEQADEAAQIVLAVYQEAVTYQNLLEVQILAPFRSRGECSVKRLNEEIQKRINPPDPCKKELKYGAQVFRELDKVIQTKNREAVSNGDVGLIVSITQDEEEGDTVRVLFSDERAVDYSAEELSQLELAYATTIHKSQGSEYHTVIIPILKDQYIMLRRNLLYTAVSRAKQQVSLVGQKQALWITGAKQKLGAPHACGLHFARPQAACQTGAAYLTEGIMKADIAAWFSHRCFLAVPGVSHYSAVRNALPACRELGIHTVLMAFDMDMYENPAVANCFQTIRGILLEEGFQVKQITWDRAFKGIDDYLKGQIIRPN